MKYILSILIISLLLLSACSKGTIEARPIDAQVINVDINVKSDLCEDVQCNQDFHCISGQCVCNDDLQICNNKCIADNLCCDSSDCSLGEFCEQGNCVKHVCPINQVYDSTKEGCICDEDSSWCTAQNKCIPRSNCCVHSDCGNDRSCSPTYFMTSVCINDGRERCRSTLEGQNAYFTINNQGYDITVDSVSNDFVSLTINDEELKDHPVKVPYQLTETIQIYVEDIQIAGGVCREV